MMATKMMMQKLFLVAIGLLLVATTPISATKVRGAKGKGTKSVDAMTKAELIAYRLELLETLESVNTALETQFDENNQEEEEHDDEEEDEDNDNDEDEVYYDSRRHLLKYYTDSTGGKPWLADAIHYVNRVGSKSAIEFWQNPTPLSELVSAAHNTFYTLHPEVTRLTLTLLETALKADAGLLTLLKGKVIAAAQANRDLELLLVDRVMKLVVAPTTVREPNIVVDQVRNLFQIYSA